MKLCQERRLRFGLVVGEHGDEAAWPLELAEQPPKGVEVFVACPENVRDGLRVRHRNIAVCYPGNPKSDIYEERRAAAVLQWALERDFDAIFNVHTNNHHSSDYMFTGPQTDEQVVDLGSLLQFKRVVVGREYPVNGTSQLPNLVVLDYSPDNPHASARELRYALEEISVEYLHNRPYLIPLDFFDHVMEFTIDEARELGLKDSYEPFECLPDLDSPMGGRLHAMLWGARHNPAPYIGEIVRKHSFQY
jgi:hypothetical protein